MEEVTAKCSFLFFLVYEWTDDMTGVMSEVKSGQEWVLVKGAILAKSLMIVQIVWC